MADVTDVCLRVERAATPDATWSVSATYTLTFEPWERSAWFREQVEVVGVTPRGERVVATLTGPPFVPAADDTGSAPLTLHRGTATVTLPESTLDVNPDLVLLAPGVRMSVHLEDHVFARVAVVPLVPEVGCGTSPLKTAQFGMTRAADR